MVTTVENIITDALEQLGVKDARSGLDATEAAQALRVLQQMILNLPGMRVWNEVECSGNYTAGENERIRVITQNAVTITIPVAVSSARTVLYCCNQYELRCEGYDDKAPKDGARVHVCDAYADNATTYFYRADIAQWTRADGLTLSSECPLSADFDGDLSAMLAGRLARYHGAALDQITVALAVNGESKMRARFSKRQDVAVDTALLRTSSNPNWMVQ